VTTDAARTPPRVVSLLPAATEIVAALGAVGQLVGVTHECDHPRDVATLPRVTSSAVDRDATSAAIDAEVRALASTGAPVFGFDAERFATLAPQVVLTQSLCDVCALPESEVDHAIAALDVAPSVVTLGGTTMNEADADVWWSRLRQQTHDFFRAEDKALWRLSLPATAPIEICGGDLVEWSGALRWLRSARAAPCGT